MAPQKSERIMNLAICLLMARRFLPKTEIRSAVSGYGGLSDQAFERTFERDKDELRALGVPLETGGDDPLFPDEVGYRIRREDFELPAIEFTPAEAAALGVATRVWESATQADHTLSALAKLRAVGVDPDPGRLSALTPSVGAKEHSFEPLWQATAEATPVAFGYHGRERHVQPWAMTYRRGSWYLLGHDADAREPRTFKLVRIEPDPDGGADVRMDGPSGSFSGPGEGVIRDLLAKLEPSPPDTDAILALRDGRASALRRVGEPCDWDGPLPVGYGAYRVAYASRGDFVGDVCGFGPDALVLAPPQLRQAALRHLRAVQERA